MKKAAKRFLKSEFFFHYKKNLPAIIGTVLIGIAIFVALFGILRESACRQSRL